MEIEMDALAPGDRDKVLSHMETWKLAEGVYAPLGRMASPDWYCRTKDQFEMLRP